MENVLRVLADLEPFGGTSLELVACELGTDQGAVEEAWSQALDDGLLEHSGTDRSSGEDTWRVSERGRQTHETQATRPVEAARPPS